MAAFADFATEFQRRRAHLEQLPGKVYHEWAESLNRAAKLFSRNTEELCAHLGQFVGQPTVATELPEEFDEEAARLLLNYLAALAGLRDAQRVVHRRLWPDPVEEAGSCEKCGRSDPKRTKWETTVWDPKRLELLGDARIVFLTKLRDYSLHYATPVMTVATQFRSLGGSGGPMQMANSVGIARDKLLEWSGWNATSRAFITEHDGDIIDLLPLVAFFSQRVREFITWFGAQIDGAVGQEAREYVEKHNDLRAWYKVHEASAQYRAVRNSEHHRRRVNARLERAAYTPVSWRVEQ
ncbi:hypothetical protein ACJH6J_25600 [Mycobacterium sp. SMC-18]|uniref:hypothetical protein n=1 Tax=Mycobacterium sp. SMC-18 TaxID=3381629 RepID=UPI0038770356